MKGKIFLKVLLGILFLSIVIILLKTFIAEPWIGNKIQTALNEKTRDYIIEIDKVHISIIPSRIELKKITISPKQGQGVKKDLYGKISSVKFKGIKLAKALFKKEFDIREVSILNSNFKGKVIFPEKAKPLKASNLNIRIGKVLFDKINLEIEDTSTAQAFSVKEGALKLYGIEVEKLDTLSPDMVQQFNFEAAELLSVSADSMYTFKASNIIYSDTSNTLSVKSLYIQPNYTNYDFTARHKYETDRIEAKFSNIFLYNFPAEAYVKSNNLACSYIEIGRMDINVFRDKRKEFKHVKKPSIQEMLFNYPGVIRIDSMSLLNGNVTYSEHAEKANEPGTITFNKLNAKIYNITNDSVSITENATLELIANALIMGKGRINMDYKAKLFDKDNTFSVTGRLSGLEAKELNPMLEKNAFIYATSGKIDEMSFNFIANNTKANGRMTVLYHGLNLAVKNKRTDDTTAIKEQLISFIANIKVQDSNPTPGEKVRVGIIDYERDPEKFIFNYWVKSIISGIKSSLVKNPKEKKSLLQKIFGKSDDKRKE